MLEARKSPVRTSYNRSTLDLGSGWERTQLSVRATRFQEILFINSKESCERCVPSSGGKKREGKKRDKNSGQSVTSQRIGVCLGFCPCPLSYWTADLSRLPNSRCKFWCDPALCPRIYTAAPVTALRGHFQLPACGPTASPVFLFSTLTLPNSTCLLSKQQALWTCPLCQQMAFSLPSCHLWYLLSSGRPSHRSCPLCCPWNPPSLLWISPALLPPTFSLISKKSLGGLLCPRHGSSYSVFMPPDQHPLCQVHPFKQVVLKIQLWSSIHVA